jgi:hypothetical protein
MGLYREHARNRAAPASRIEETGGLITQRVRLIRSFTKGRVSLVRRVTSPVSPSRPLENAEIVERLAKPIATPGTGDTHASTVNQSSHNQDHGNDHDQGCGKHRPHHYQPENTARRVRRLRRTVLSYAQAVEAGLTKGGARIAAVSLVLTWRYSNGYRPAHIAQVIERYTDWLSRRDIPYAYLWVLETQSRGAPHLHVVFFVPYRTQLPWPTRIPRRGRVVPWPHGIGKFERARSITAMVGYVAKAATKHNLPKGARVFGIGGVRREWKQAARWAALPTWLREKTVPGEKLVRVPGLGMRSAVTGDLIACPWYCTWEGVGSERHLRFTLKDDASILSYEELRQRPPVATAASVPKARLPS